MRSLVLACGALFFVLVGIYVSERKHASQLAALGTISKMRKRQELEKSLASVTSQDTIQHKGRAFVGPNKPLNLQEKSKHDLQELGQENLNLQKIYGPREQARATARVEEQLKNYQVTLDKLLLNPNSDLNEITFLQAEIVRIKHQLGRKTTNVERWSPTLLLYLIHDEKYRPSEIAKARNHEYFGYTKEDWENLKRQQAGQVQERKPAQKVAKVWKASGPKGKWVDEENVEEVSDEFAANDYKVYKLEE